jgi:uncharacterized membrane protein YfcA
VIVLIVIGVIGGVLSGAFGVGGGIVMVPLLVGLAKMDQRRASATSLLAILPASIVGSITYLAHGSVDLLAALLLAVGAIVGTLIGSWLLSRVPLAVLRWLFIALVVVTAVRLVFISPERADAAEFSLLAALGYLAIGLAMGVCSGLFGIGGGVIAVPALVAVTGASDLIAKGTSLLAMIPTSAVGTWSNWRRGNVDLRAGVVVGASAAVASVPGAFLAIAMSPRVSTLLFAGLLVLVAVQLGVRAVRSQPEG